MSRAFSGKTRGLTKLRIAHKPVEFWYGIRVSRSSTAELYRGSKGDSLGNYRPKKQNKKSPGANPPPV